MKTRTCDLSWLPPFEDWDFRAIASPETDMACLWEYTRELGRFTSDPACWVHFKKPRKEHRFRVFLAGRMNIPWVALSAEKRAQAMLAFHRPYPLSRVELPKLISETLEFYKGDHKQALESLSGMLLDVIGTNVEECGVEKVVEAFAALVKEEAKQYRKPPRGKANTLAFGYFKWLSAFRLESQRTKAGISFEEAQLALKAYQQRNPVDNCQDVLPLYASHGAWSKALSDAKRLLKHHEAGGFDLVLRLFNPAAWPTSRQEGTPIKLYQLWNVMNKRGV